MRFILSFLSLLILAIAPPASAAPAKPDWSRTVALSATGGHVLGNPKAPRKLIGFVSYTCPHCAHFEAEGSTPLIAGWVRPGTVSFEIRNLVRDRYDLAAALLARCGGPQRFYGNHHAIFAWHEKWLERVQAYDSAPSALPGNASQVAILQDIAARTGLIGLMTKRGFTPAQLRACIADPKALQTILGMTQDAYDNVGVSGTPSFVLDGRLTDAHDWAHLRDLLPGALPARRT